MAKCDLPIRRRDLLETVAQIVKKSGKPTPFKEGKPEEKGYRYFLRRHQDTKAVVTEEMIGNWFTRLKEFLDEQGFLEAPRGYKNLYEIKITKKKKISLCMSHSMPAVKYAHH